MVVILTQLVNNAEHLTDILIQQYINPPLLCYSTIYIQANYIFHEGMEKPDLLEQCGEKTGTIISWPLKCGKSFEENCDTKKNNTLIPLVLLHLKST